MEFSLKNIMRRSFDRILVIILSPILISLSLVTAIMVRLKLGSPVFYTQIRGGYLERNFHIRKFRSMSNQCDDNGNLLPDAERLTSFGQRIRAMRLDELPSFWHILTGEIALVGPRPLLPATVSNHKLGWLRQQVPPGFTGLAQVSGNTLLSEDEKIALDCYYISKQSLFLDIMIILQTFIVITTSEKRDEVTISKAMEYCEQLEIKQKPIGAYTS